MREVVAMILVSEAKSKIEEAPTPAAELSCVIAPATT